MTFSNASVYESFLRVFHDEKQLYEKLVYEKQVYRQSSLNQPFNNLKLIMESDHLKMFYTKA